MQSEGRGQRGGVGVHIQHRLEGMAEMANPRALEVVKHFGDAAPAGEFALSLKVFVESADNCWRHLLAQPDRYASELGQRADIVVLQLHPDSRVFIVQPRPGLQSDKYERDIEIAEDWRDSAGGRIGDHIAENEIEVRGLHPPQRGLGGFSVIYHPEIGHRDPSRLELAFKIGKVPKQCLEQAWELAPVGVQSDCEQPNFGGKRLATRDLHCSALLLGRLGHHDISSSPVTLRARSALPSRSGVRKSPSI